MTIWLNYTIILLTVAVVLLIIGYAFIKRNQLSNEETPESERQKYTISAIDSFIRDRVTNLTTENLYSLGLTEDEFIRKTKRRHELKEALKNCNTGDLGSKVFVREYIHELLHTDYKFNEENINWTIPFNYPNQLTTRDMFDILMFLQWKKYSVNGLGSLIDTYGLADPKEDGSYRITASEVRHIYKQEVKNLLFEDKMRIISQRIYSHFKGFGIIDDIRDMAIDGVSGGVSGIPKHMNAVDEQALMASVNETSSGLNSVWVMYRGKSIHFEFLDFGHESELRRVVQNIYKFNFPGQLSEGRPYIINEMYDGSRVTVVRPKFSESWAFFIRKKYNVQKLDVEQLITHPNADIPIKLMKYLMKGNRVTAVTGAQGSGKTTLLMALVGDIHKALNLRIQETAFELNLRTIYPDRNILSFQETDTISGQDGLDLQKKTDGAVNILGEVATDPVAAWMIQTAQVASLFTLFTHHAKTFADLVYALRNSLLKVGTFNNEAIAEQQVVGVLEFNIHLKQDYDGSRYVERITECIPKDFQGVEINLDDTVEVTQEKKMDLLLTAATNYFRQQTQKQQFEARDLVRFENGKYVAGEAMSKQRIADIYTLLPDSDKEEFAQFVQNVWGVAV